MRRLPESSGTELLRDLLESLILRVPRVGGSRTAPLARFVAALALDASLDLTAPEAVAWAESTGARIELNDAREELGRGVAARRMRLVIGLHATVADGWPESLGLWLLDGGQVCERTELPVSPPRTRWRPDSGRPSAGRDATRGCGVRPCARWTSPYRPGC